MSARHPASRSRAAFAAILGALVVAACTGEGGDAGETSAEPSSESLATLITGANDLTVVSGTLTDAGLVQVFDGVAAYTVLAPQDAAFERLGEAGKALRAPEQRAALVAALRDHIVPGYLTPEDIAKAVELDEDGRVAMRTMAGRTLTFANTDGAITATGEDGVTVRFAGEPLFARNGVAIPVDGLVVDVGGAPAAR